MWNYIIPDITGETIGVYKFNNIPIYYKFTEDGKRRYDLWSSLTLYR